MAYDGRCATLARVFLDTEAWATDEEVAALAQAIQDTVEDYIEATRPDDDAEPEAHP